MADSANLVGWRATGDQGKVASCKVSPEGGPVTFAKFGLDTVEDQEWLLTKDSANRIIVALGTIIRGKESEEELQEVSKEVIAGQKKDSGELKHEWGKG